MSNSGLSYAQVMIGRAMTGLIGLREIMSALADEGLTADAPEIGKRLIEEIREHNYVPKQAALAYEAALIREYCKYLGAQKSGTDGHVWRDPRKEHKPWYPTLFAEKCNGCSKCPDACPNHVLGWDLEHVKVLVLEPYECAPGCEQCVKACPKQAIVMPPKAVLYMRMEGASPSQTGS